MRVAAQAGASEGSLEAHGDGGAGCGEECEGAGADCGAARARSEHRALAPTPPSLCSSLAPALGNRFPGTLWEPLGISANPWERVSFVTTSGGIPFLTYCGSETFISSSTPDYSVGFWNV